MEENKKENNFIIGVVDAYVSEISDNWLNISVIGILFIVFGLIFLIWPEKTIVFIAYIIGLMAIITGVWTLSAAFKVKKIKKNYQRLKDELKSKFFD
ncbi:MAG: DUF308 domain-containing protein [Candidatus Paceibacterota bacterium]